MLVVGCVGLPARSAGERVLIVHFEGLASDEGRIAAALTDSAEHFLSRDHPPLRRYFGRIANRRSTWKIQDLPFATYAISAYHDRNENHELDSSWLGVPSEAYGFSNDARAALGPPGFDEASFEFRRSGQVLTIRLE